MAQFLQRQAQIANQGVQGNSNTTPQVAVGVPEHTAPATNVSSFANQQAQNAYQRAVLEAQQAAARRQQANKIKDAANISWALLQNLFQLWTITDRTKSTSYRLGQLTASFLPFVKYLGKAQKAYDHVSTIGGIVQSLTTDPKGAGAKRIVKAIIEQLPPPIRNFIGSDASFVNPAELLPNLLALPADATDQQRSEAWAADRSQLGTKVTEFLANKIITHVDPKYQEGFKKLVPLALRLSRGDISQGEVIKAGSKLFTDFLTEKLPPSSRQDLQRYFDHGQNLLQAFKRIQSNPEEFFKALDKQFPDLGDKVPLSTRKLLVHFANIARSAPTAPGDSFVTKIKKKFGAVKAEAVDAVKSKIADKLNEIAKFKEKIEKELKSPQSSRSVQVLREKLNEAKAELFKLRDQALGEVSKRFEENRKAGIDSLANFLEQRGLQRPHAVLLASELVSHLHNQGVIGDEIHDRLQKNLLESTGLSPADQDLIKERLQDIETLREAHLHSPAEVEAAYHRLTSESLSPTDIRHAQNYAAGKDFDKPAEKQRGKNISLAEKALNPIEKITGTAANFFRGEAENHGLDPNEQDRLKNLAAQAADFLPDFLHAFSGNLAPIKQRIGGLLKENLEPIVQEGLQKVLETFTSRFTDATSLRDFIAKNEKFVRQLLPETPETEALLDRFKNTDLTSAPQLLKEVQDTLADAIHDKLGSLRVPLLDVLQKVSNGQASELNFDDHLKPLLTNPTLVHLITSELPPEAGSFIRDISDIVRSNPANLPDKLQEYAKQKASELLAGPREQLISQLQAHLNADQIKSIQQAFKAGQSPEEVFRHVQEFIISSLPPRYAFFGKIILQNSREVLKDVSDPASKGKNFVRRVYEGFVDRIKKAYNSVVANRKSIATEFIQGATGLRPDDLQQDALRRKAHQLLQDDTEIKPEEPELPPKATVDSDFDLDKLTRVPKTNEPEEDAQSFSRQRDGPEVNDEVPELINRPPAGNKGGSRGPHLIDQNQSQSRFQRSLEEQQPLTSAVKRPKVSTKEQRQAEAARQRAEADRRVIEREERIAAEEARQAEIERRNEEERQEDEAQRRRTQAPEPEPAKVPLKVPEVPRAPTQKEIDDEANLKIRNAQIRETYEKTKNHAARLQQHPDEAVRQKGKELESNLKQVVKLSKTAKAEGRNFNDSIERRVNELHTNAVTAIREHHVDAPANTKVLNESAPTSSSSEPEAEGGSIQGQQPERRSTQTTQEPVRVNEPETSLPAEANVGTKAQDKTSGGPTVAGLADGIGGIAQGVFFGKEAFKQPEKPKNPPPAPPKEDLSTKPSPPSATPSTPPSTQQPPSTKAPDTSSATSSTQPAPAQPASAQPASAQPAPTQSPQASTTTNASKSTTEPTKTAAQEAADSSNTKPSVVEGAADEAAKAAGTAAKAEEGASDASKAAEVGTTATKVTKAATAGEDALEGVQEAATAGSAIADGAVGDFPGALLAAGATGAQILGTIEGSKSSTVHLPPPPTQITDPNQVTASNNNSLGAASTSNAISAV